MSVQLGKESAMTAGGININSYYNSYNNRYVAGIPDDNKIVTAQEPVKEEQLQADSSESRQSDEKERENKSAAHASPKEFTFDFGYANKFNLVAAQSSVEDVDIKKAVMDMKKDTVLNQYKFFVGTTSEGTPNLGTDADGTVRLKNF